MEKIIKFVRETMGFEPTGHDYYHAKRVAKLAKELYLMENQEDKNSLRIILAASYLHDTVDVKLVENTDKEKEKIILLLESSNFSEQEVAKIIYIIDNMSFSKNLESKKNLPMEGKYVQDADWLDALGAIGIARTFAFGGKQGNLIYDPKIKPNLVHNTESYSKKDGTSINHFYEKLLKISNQMNTKAGKKIAIKRTKYMEKYLKEFFEEWNVKIDK